MLDVILGKKLNWIRGEQPIKVLHEGPHFGKDWFYQWNVESRTKTGVWFMDYENEIFNSVKNNERILQKENDFKQVTDVKWSLDSERFELMKAHGSWATDDLKITGDNLKLKGTIRKNQVLNQ